MVSVYEVNDCIKALQYIYNFEPIKNIRSEYINSGKYRIKKEMKLYDKNIKKNNILIKDRNDVINKTSNSSNKGGRK